MKSGLRTGLLAMGIVLALLAMGCDTSNSAIGSQADAELAAKVITAGAAYSFSPPATDIHPPVSAALIGGTWDDPEGGTVTWAYEAETEDPDFGTALAFTVTFSDAHFTYNASTYVLDGTVDCVAGMTGGFPDLRLSSSGFSIDGGGLAGTCTFDYLARYDIDYYTYVYSGTVGGKSVSGNFELFVD